MFAVINFRVLKGKRAKKFFTKKNGVGRLSLFVRVCHGEVVFTSGWQALEENFFVWIFHLSDFFHGHLSGCFHISGL